MYNKAILMGRICNDLELKSTPSGNSVLSFAVAVERAYQAKGEERKTDFFNCVAWRANADFISRFFSKGRMILIDGELQNRKYTDKNGVERYITEIIVDRAYFTGESGKPPQNNQNQSQNQTSGNDQPPAQAQEYTAADFVPSPTDDDYPF